MRMREVGILLLGALAGTLLFGRELVCGAPDTLTPPAGAVTGTGHTVTEIYDKLESLEVLVNGLACSSNREVLLITNLAEGQSTTIGGTGHAILHSVIVETSGVRVVDDNGNGSDLGVIYAQATYRGNTGLIKYDSSFQAFFGMEVTLPLKVYQAQGSGQTAYAN